LKQYSNIIQKIFIQTASN